MADRPGFVRKAAQTRTSTVCRFLNLTWGWQSAHSALFFERLLKAQRLDLRQHRGRDPRQRHGRSRRAHTEVIRNRGEI